MIADPNRDKTVNPEKMPRKGIAFDRLPPHVQRQAMELDRVQNPRRVINAPIAAAAAEDAKPRLRQKREKPLNKTEAELMGRLALLHPTSQVTPHPMKLRIANGSEYWPDFMVHRDGERPQLWECKGPKMWDDAIVKVKVAAYQHRWADFWLATPTDRAKVTWRIERVLP